MISCASALVPRVSERAAGSRLPTLAAVRLRDRVPHPLQAQAPLTRPPRASLADPPAYTPPPPSPACLPPPRSARGLRPHRDELRRVHDPPGRPAGGSRRPALPRLRDQAGRHPGDGLHQRRHALPPRRGVWWRGGGLARLGSPPRYFLHPALPCSLEGDPLPCWPMPSSCARACLPPLAWLAADLRAGSHRVPRLLQRRGKHPRHHRP